MNIPVQGTGTFVNVRLLSVQFFRGRLIWVRLDAQRCVDCEDFEQEGNVSIRSVKGSDGVIANERRVRSKVFWERAAFYKAGWRARVSSHPQLPR